MEWIHRGTRGGDFWSARVQPHPWGFIFEWLFLVLLYVFISQLSGLHWLATLLTGCLLYTSIMPMMAATVELMAYSSPV